MKPYYQDDAVVIYHGDCREILPQLEPVDLVVTDPPYGIGAACGIGGDNKARVMRTQDTWDDQRIDKDLLELVLRAGYQRILFGGNYYELPPSPCWLVWHKAHIQDNFADCELAWTSFNKPTRYFFFLWRGFWRGQVNGCKEVRFHPTQKPVEVMRWCIQQADRSDTILDPFMGSGTTLRAAKDLGRKAIGIEIEEKYCEIAAKRMAQEVLPL